MVGDGNKQLALRRRFVIMGALVGTVISCWYLFSNLQRSAIPDPVWTRFVNVALIMFVSIFLANLVRRLVGKVSKKG